MVIRKLALLLVSVIFLATACTGSTIASPTPTGSPVLLGGASPSAPPSALPSASASAPSGPPASAPGSAVACELASQQEVSMAVGAQMPPGKAGAPKLLAQQAAHTNCYFTNGQVPAANALIEVIAYQPDVPVDSIEAMIIARLLSVVGTKDGVTTSAAKATIGGHPGVTSLISGTGVNNVPVHVETAAFWSGQLTVSVTVGNGTAGAALSLAQLIAGRLP
jgi:hypothetical protein